MTIRATRQEAVTVQDVSPSPGSKRKAPAHSGGAQREAVEEQGCIQAVQVWMGPGLPAPDLHTAWLSGAHWTRVPGDMTHTI